MAKEIQKSYCLGPTFHKVNVFHLDTFYRFFHISCQTCKLQNKCKDAHHKREICAASKKVENLLIDFMHGHVNGFVADDFFILTKKDEQERLKKIFKFLLMKYAIEQNVKD